MFCSIEQLHPSDSDRQVCNLLGEDHPSDFFHHKLMGIFGLVMDEGHRIRHEMQTMSDLMMCNDGHKVRNPLSWIRYYHVSEECR